MRVFAYVDAFNLYYGALANSDHKWLNLEALFDGLIPKHDVIRIKYFTANVKGSPVDPGQPQRQQAYFKALKTLPRVEIIKGSFLVEQSRMRTVAPPHERILVQKENEKGSDVNLATHMIFDGFADVYDMAVVVTGDSDQVLPIEMVRTELKKHVRVINPQSRPSAELKKAATSYHELRPNFLAKCQFPETIRTSSGLIYRPAVWAPVNPPIETVAPE